MRFPTLSLRSTSAALTAAIILAACGGHSSSLVPTGAANNGAHPLGSVPGSPVPTASPTPGVSHTNCGGTDGDDCFGFRFILPLRASLSGGALSLSVDGGGEGLPCLAYLPDNQYAFSVTSATDASTSDITQPDYCAWFEDVGIDSKKASLHPMAFATAPPGTTPTPAPTATPQPTNPPGHLYIVEVAVTCSNGHGGDGGDERGRDDSMRTMSERHDHHGRDRDGGGDGGDGGDRHHRGGCEATADNTVIAALAGPGTRDGQGSISFPTYTSSVHFAPGVKYFFFLGHLEDNDDPVPHL